MNPLFITVYKGRSFTEITLELWQVEVHIRETDRDLRFIYQDKDKALRVAKRIADKLHEKVLRRTDIHRPKVRFDKYDPDNYKLVWHKVTSDEEYIAMKDYVYVRDITTSTVVLGATAA